MYTVPVAPSRNAHALNHRHGDLSEEHEEEHEEIEGAVRPEKEINILIIEKTESCWKTETIRKSEMLPIAENKTDKVCLHAKITKT